MNAQWSVRAKVEAIGLGPLMRERFPHTDPTSSSTGLPPIRSQMRRPGRLVAAVEGQRVHVQQRVMVLPCHQFAGRFFRVHAGQAEGTIRAIFSSFTNPTPTTPAPAPPSRAPEPVPAVVPSPAVPAAVTVPVVPAPVTVPTEPSSGERQAASDRGRQAPRDTPPRSAAPETDGKPAAPGVSRAGGVPSQANKPAMDWTPGNGNAKGRVRSGGWTGQNGSAQHGTGQNAGQPRTTPAQGNGR
jgi:hypothetical protein